jgi:hypothetical protein
MRRRSAGVSMVARRGKRDRSFMGVLLAQRGGGARAEK